MSQSLSKLYIHLIFHIKKSANTPILKEHRQELYAYIGTVIKDMDSQPILINGTDDHIHIFCILSKNIALSLFAKDIKRHSSRWIKTRNNHYKNFTWQGGYAGFSVSLSFFNKTVDYIKNQEEHHKKVTFRDEYLLFLKEHNIEFDENHLWNN